MLTSERLRIENLVKKALHCAFDHGQVNMVSVVVPDHYSKDEVEAVEEKRRAAERAVIDALREADTESTP